MLDPLHPAQSAIVEILAARPRLKMPDLHQGVIDDHQVKISLPNLYRIVAQLVKEQVLVKAKGQLSLNHIWASQLVSVADQAKENYLEIEEKDVDFDLKEGERRDYYADTLMNLDTIWNDLLMQITEHLGKRNWYAYQSHPWYPLGMLNVTSRFYETLVKKEVNMYRLYGNDSFLDRYGCKLTDRFDGFIAKTDDNPPFLKEGYSLWLSGDYITESVFPDVLNRHFAAFFQTVKSVDQFDAQLFGDVFRMKARCKVTLRRSKADADMLREKIRSFFPEVEFAKNAK